jgi:Gluconate 2-dehydrogenase subunit 3
MPAFYSCLSLSKAIFSMNRRNLLKGMSVVALSGSFPAILGEFISSCNNKEKTLRAGFFSDEEFSLIEQVTDTLLPKTTTPGALEARVPYFIDLVVKNCMSQNDQQLIKKGLKTLEVPGQKFSTMSAADKLIAIRKMDEAAFGNDPDKTWFPILKKLATIGYFTSREGMTTALNYVKVPGDYKACIPYKEGDMALAKTFLLYW